MAFVLKSSIHWLVSFQLMLLIVIGRKTGRQFEIPVSFAKLDGVYVALTLKANQWWRNLRGGTCTAVIRGERVACTIHIIDEDVSSIEQNLRALINHNPLDAPFAGVRLNWRLKPNEDDLRTAAQRHVVLRLEASDSSANTTPGS
jgi:hypothetical protein